MSVSLGASKCLFKIVIAMIDTVFVYWAKLTFEPTRQAQA